MNEVEAHTIEQVITILRSYEPQKIEVSDDPRRLKFGWKIDRPEVWITVPLIEAKARWPKAVFELIMSEKGREAIGRAHV